VEYVRPVAPHRGEVSAPVDLASLRAACLRLPLLLSQGALRELGDGGFVLRWGGQLHRITFDRARLAEQAEATRLFSYGDPLFDQFLAGPLPSDADLAAFGLARHADDQAREIRWQRDGRDLLSLEDLLAVLR
jgi:hypothetical protein